MKSPRPKSKYGGTGQALPQMSYLDQKCALSNGIGLMRLNYVGFRRGQTRSPRSYLIEAGKGKDTQ